MTAVQRSQSRPSSRRLAGFTLVEILVTVSIIVILIGLVVVVGAKMQDSGKASSTKSLLASVIAIDTEYEVQTNGQHVDHADTTVEGPTVDLENKSIVRLVRGAQLYPSTREVLNRLPQEKVRDDDGDGRIDSIVDAWEKKLIYVRNSATGDANTGFLPPRNAPFAASAGPDKLWGDANAAAGTQAYNEAQDNIYSFNLD